MCGCAEELARAALEFLSIAVAELLLDMLRMRLNCFSANAKFFCDLTSAMFSRNECEHRQLPIAEDIETVWKFATTGELVHGNGGDCSTGVDLARQHSLNRVH